MEKRKIADNQSVPDEAEDLTTRLPAEPEEAHYPPGDEDDSDDERPDENEAVRKT